MKKRYKLRLFNLPTLKLPPNFFPSGEEPVITERDMDLWKFERLDKEER